MELIIYSFLGLWFLFSLLSQSHSSKMSKALRRVDTFGLIPSWTFFGPNPGTTDYHLLFRTYLSTGDHGEWKELKLYEGWTWYAWLWNKNKRKQKAISDAVSALVQLSEQMKPQGLKSTIPYLMILNYVSGIGHSPFMNQTQFMIMDSQGYYSENQPNVLFISERHKLSD